MTAAALFLALGAALLAGAAVLPPGIGRLPGPGFFPAAVGAITIVLGGFLMAASFGQRRASAPETRVNLRLLACGAALLFLYILLWEVVPFALRTALFLAVFLRLAGERWRSALAVSLVLTGAVLLAFQYGLRVSFG
jgi:hypothetical protein